MEIFIDKYGGSSITSHEDVKRIKNICDDDKRRRIVVVSAPGKRYSYDNKVTDLLIELAKAENLRRGELFKSIIERFKFIASKTSQELISGLEKLLDEKISKSIISGEAYLDRLKAFGEEASARVVAEINNFYYIDPRELFLVSSEFGNAKILPESGEMIRKKLGSLLEKTNQIFVIPGFFGSTDKKEIATFSRGGSDLTGSYIASSLNATLYENFTDREGIFSANPDIIENPHKIDELTFDEMRDLSYSGFGIFHQEAVIPVQKARVPIHVRSTRDYPKNGTYIVVDRILNSKNPIIGIAYRDKFCSFNVTNPGLNDRVGIIADVLTEFKKRKISIEHVATGIDDISVIMNQTQFKGGLLNSVINGIYELMNNEGKVGFTDNLGCLVVAGKGLKGNRGIAGQIQKELSDDGINIRFMSQGEQERCIIYGINSEDGKKAVRCIY